MPGIERRSPADENFDVAVIGGGINGIAVARECARAGKRTLLVEQHDFGSGTTSRSTRIIHGGLRYLEHGELLLVRESLRERERLLRERPHLVRPIQFLLALERGTRHNALAIRAGLWFYSSLGGSSSWLGVKRATSNSLERILDQERKWSIFSYEDAQCEFPERLVAEWLREAAQAGATLRNYTEMLEVKVTDGGVAGLRLRDRISGDEFQIRCEWIFNATGPWADRVTAQSGLASKQRMVQGVRGSHILLARFPGAPESAIYGEAADGRPIFVVPWNRQLLVGTTEVSDDADPGCVQPSSEEIEYLVASFRRLFPGVKAEQATMQAAYAGVRPLPWSPGEKLEAIPRRHRIHDHSHEGARGMFSVIGGKLTTAAAVARECAEKLGLKCSRAFEMQVAMAPADGIESSLRQWSTTMARKAGISCESARGLAEWYGGCGLGVARLAESNSELREPICEHSSHILAEAIAAMQREQTVTLADILLRRVPVALNSCWNEKCTRQAAASLGRVLGWGQSAIAEQAAAFDEERARFLVGPSNFPALRPSAKSAA